ncbi:MAG: ABC transporter permease, partial [Ferrovibrionaceae bacterium]
MKSLFRFPGTATVASLGLAFLYLPILALLILSFNENDLITIWTGFSARWYEAVFTNADMLQAARNSLIVAACATLFATAAATAATLGVARARAAWKAAVEGLLGLPILVPEIVTA